METLGDSLQKLLSEKNITKLVEVDLEHIFSHPYTIQWWQKHPHWTKDDLLPFATKFKHAVKEHENCQGCSGLNYCQNIMKGHCGHIIEYGNMLDVSYSPCAYQLQADQERKSRQLIKSHHIPKDIIAASFKRFDSSENGRQDAFEAVLEFCLKVKPGEKCTGIYLYGPLGVGKSYLIGAACNKLAERGIQSYMVYTPAFFREMKTAIANQTVDEKIAALQTVDVLIFDDIGAETISAWARDEVLGPILQYRVMENLPTIFTSNYDYDQLEEHLSYSQKGGIEQLKAKRIMERIRHYTRPCFMEGSNRREN